MNYDKIGSFIALKRKEKGLTQKDLALKLGVTDKAVSKWERGLGCPDVSILEILSKELDVSILEILKGRMIEDEVIKVTDMNDYVKETVNYSNYNNQVNLKRIFSKLIIFLVIILGGFLIILNIEHIFYLNKKYEYDFNSNYIMEVKEIINKIENNINIIKNNQGSFTDSDYQVIVNYFDRSFDKYKNMPFLKYDGIKEFNLHDIYILDKALPSRVDMGNVIVILKNCDKSIEDDINLYNKMSTVIMFLGNDTYTETSVAYKYRVPSFFDYEYNTDQFKIPTRIYTYGYMVEMYYNLTKMVIKVGGMNE